MHAVKMRPSSEKTATLILKFTMSGHFQKAGLTRSTMPSLVAPTVTANYTSVHNATILDWTLSAVSIGSGTGQRNNICLNRCTFARAIEFSAFSF